MILRRFVDRWSRICHLGRDLQMDSWIKIHLAQPSRGTELGYAGTVPGVVCLPMRPFHYVLHPLINPPACPRAFFPFPEPLQSVQCHSLR